MHRLLLAMLVAIAWSIPASANGADDKAMKLTDAEITKLLVGKWTVEEGKGNEPKVKGMADYKKDGAFDVQVTIESGDKVEKIEVSGTWTVMNGVILDTVKKTNSVRVKEGQVTKDTVISIDDKTLRYTTAKGLERLWKRVKE